MYNQRCKEEETHLEEVILMDHAAVGQRLDEPVGQGGFATIGDPAGSGARQRWKNRIRTGLGATGTRGGTDTAEGAEP